MERYPRLKWPTGFSFLGAMIKIFYVGGSASSSGMLRAVLPEAQFSGLPLQHEFTYVGPGFPFQEAGEPPATILEFSGPSSENWQSGFYKAKHPPVQFEEVLRNLLG